MEVLAAIRQGLDEAGLAHVGNLGPDTCTHLRPFYPIPHMLEIGADPDPHLDGYSMHHYHSHFDWDRPSTAFDRSDPLTRDHRRAGGGILRATPTRAGSPI